MVILLVDLRLGLGCGQEIGMSCSWSGVQTRAGVEMALIDVFLTAFTSLCGDYLEGHQIL